MSSTVAIIQARMSSTRLPQKVLRSLFGKPMLYWVIHRIQQARLVDSIWIATTTNSADDSIVEFCNSQGLNVYRGSEDDVLDRYYQTTLVAKADNILRITSDDPMIDPHIIDWLIGSYYAVSPKVDYASNNKPRSFPLGLDIEVFCADKLAQIWQADTSSWREHVTPYFYQHPEQFRLHNIVNPVDYSHYRWTVDTAEDFELIQRIYEYFGHGDFHWQEAIELMEAHPDWALLNQHIEQKKV